MEKDRTALLLLIIIGIFCAGYFAGAAEKLSGVPLNC